jgi:hypothetical protein
MHTPVVVSAAVKLTQKYNSWQQVQEIQLYNRV